MVNEMMVITRRIEYETIVIGFPFGETSPQYQMVLLSPVPMICTAETNEPTQAATAKNRKTKNSEKAKIRSIFATLRKYVIFGKVSCL